ncbi:MAG TPA: ABC transporter permease [Rhodoblastus sp.]|nr:ABC transporter permease [Rhodoblastus sp.]
MTLVRTSRRTSLRQSFRIQWAILRAVTRREVTTVFGVGYGIAFVAALLEPVFHIGIIALWHWLIRVNSIYGPSKVLFISSGLYPLFVFVHLSTSFTAVARSEISERRLPTVRLSDVILARAAVKLLVYVAVGVVLFGGIALFITPMAVPHDPSRVLLAIALLAVIGVGMGFCNIAIESVLPIWHMIYSPLSRSMMLFAGVLYVPDFLPPFLRGWLAYNPILHEVILFRQGFYPNFPSISYRPGYMAVSAGVVLFVGLGSMRLMTRRLDDR